VGLDGTVYVTLLLKGELGRLDLTAGKYTKITDGLKGPGDLTVRAGQLFVTESLGDGGAGHDVVMIDKDGAKSVVAGGFDQPIGIAAGAGKTLFVSDLKAGKLVKIDDAGAKSDFVTKLDSPVQLAIEPYTLKDEPTFTLVVSTKNAVLRYDQDGKRVGNPIPFEQPTGVAGVPPTETPLVTPSTTVVAPAGAGTSTTVTTRLRPSTTRATLPLDTDTSNTTSSNVLALSIGIIGVLVVAAVVFLIVRKPKGGAAAGFEERPLDTYTVAEAFGPCAAEEVELAEAEGGLKSLVIQREAAETRAAEARVRATSAREALEAFRSGVATEVRSAASPAGDRASAEDAPAGVSPAERRAERRAATSRTQLRVQDLGLKTDAGRAALAAFARGELDAHSLEERWIELGEQQAIDAVRGVGDAKAAPPAAATDVANEEPAGETAADAVAEPSPAADHVDGADGADAAPGDGDTQEARLAEELEIAESDIEHAEREIERLLEREALAIDRIAAARGDLARCQAAHEEQARESEVVEAATANPPPPLKDDGASPADDREPEPAANRPPPPPPPSPKPPEDPPRPTTNFA
jgi:hypothetical protein